MVTCAIVPIWAYQPGLRLRFEISTEPTHLVKRMSKMPNKTVGIKRKFLGIQNQDPLPQNKGESTSS